MTRNKDVKRIIRTRMRKTGESYTAARAQVLSKAAPKQPPFARGDLDALRRDRPSAPAIDYSKLSGMKDETIAARTGRTWKDWVRALDAEGAAAMRHGEVTRLLRDKHGVADWWTQAVAVGYERIKGLRERGQRMSGAYEATKSRTYNVPVSRLFDAWAQASTRGRWLDDVNAVVRTATAPKSMRLGWPDGTIVAAWFSAKGNGRSTVALAHTKLRSKAAADEAKKLWTKRLDALGELVER